MATENYFPAYSGGDRAGDQGALPIRALVVDDNPNDRALTIRALRKEYPELITLEVRDLPEFQDALETFHHDIALIDYKLNWSNGLELLKTLKQRRPDAPVLMFTATGTEEIAVEAMKNGLDDYVLKSPRHFIRLVAAFRAALENYRVRRRAKWMETRIGDLLLRVNFGVYHLSPRGMLLFANRAFYRMFGLASWLEAPEWRLEEMLADPEDAARLAGELRRTGMVREPELKLRRADGSDLWVSLVQILHPAVEGVGMVEGIIEDITERKGLALALRRKEAERKESERLESVGRLAGGVAHDFNNLLTTIAGHSELLLHAAGNDSYAREGLLEIRKAGERAGLLTRQLLAFGRRMMMRPARLEVATLIRRMEADIRQCLGPAIDLRLNLAPDTGAVMADPDMLAGAILTLAVNAGEAMPAGGTLTVGCGWVEVLGGARDGIPLEGRTDETPPDGSHVLIEVEDTGSGMDSETLSHIFEPFFTTKSSGSRGMGLAMAYGMLKQSGGRILVESEPGKGTRFNIYIPRIRVPPAHHGSGRQPGINRSAYPPNP